MEAICLPILAWQTWVNSWSCHHYIIGSKVLLSNQLLMYGVQLMITGKKKSGIRVPEEWDQ